MTYNPNTPINTDFINASQTDILSNFATFYTAFLANHVPLDAPSGAGNHTIVQMPEQETAFQTDVGEISVYTNFAESSTDQVFIRYQNNQIPFQFSNYQIYSIPAADGYISFFTFLPGNVLVYFGAVNITGFPFPFKLNPPIAKNIIAMNFCLSGTFTLGGGYYPWISIEVPTNNIYSVINLNDPLFQTKPGVYYYLVLANI